jgi:putative lipoic acid-binding regulatory protein
MSDNESLLMFPCDFPIKIIGLTSNNFLKDITIILQKHFPETQDTAISCRKSEQGQYSAITAIIYVLDKPSLDALYKDLTAYPGIKMVL